MKILVSAYACHPPTTAQFENEEKILGSGESILGWNLVKQISRFHDTWVITQVRNRNGVERARRQGEMAQVKFLYWDFPFWPKRWWDRQSSLHLYYYLWQARVLSLAQALQRRVHFDLCHHATFANYWMPSFIGAFLPVPFIWGPVGGGQQTPKSFLREYAWSGRISEIERSASQWIGRTLLFSHRRCQRKARAILVCNEDTRRFMPARYQDKVRFFPVNGIPREEIVPEAPPRDAADPFRVLTTGRLVYWKNFAAAIRAFAAFHSRHPRSVFEIVGEGEEAKRLHDLAAELRVSAAVRFTGWLPQKDLMEKMRASDVFLYPSLREGGGAVVVEAMACGLPVICLDHAGPGFHIHPEWGIKIAPRDPAGIVKHMDAALETLHENPAVRTAMGSAARRRAEDFYVWDRLGEKLQEIYQQALVRP